MFPLWSAFVLDWVHGQINAWKILLKQRTTCCTAYFAKTDFFYVILILSQGESDHLMKGKRAEKLNEKTVWVLPRVNVKVNVPLTVTSWTMWNLSSAFPTASPERAAALGNHRALFFFFWLLLLLSFNRIEPTTSQHQTGQTARHSTEKTASPTVEVWNNFLFSVFMCWMSVDIVCSATWHHRLNFNYSQLRWCFQRAVTN